MNARDVRTIGLVCHERNSLVERSVADLDGVIGVTSTHTSDLTPVMLDETRLDRGGVIQAIRAAGFGAEFVEVPLSLERQ